MGEVVCHNCGLVISEHAVNRGPEWRAFTKEERDGRGRTGLPTSFSIHDKGLSTMIDRGDKDAFGRRISSATRNDMYRLRKWQIRTQVHSSADRNLAQAMSDLARLADKLHIPHPVKERAAIIYRKALDEGLVRGRTIAAIAAAALYAACRLTETPRTLKDLASVTQVPKKEIARCYRLLVRELNFRMPIEDPAKCIAKISSKVNISVPTQRRAISIINEARIKGVISGKDPVGLAAAALYIACVLESECKTQRTIAKMADVTEVTVRNRYKNIREALKLKV